MSYPEDKAPFTIFGLFNGQKRYETIETPGVDKWVGLPEDINLILFEKPQGEEQWGISHQQRRARFMVLLQKPWCFHFLFVFKFREAENKTGTEVAFYLRFGLWRWDVAGTKGKHWIGPGTWFCGLHYD